MKRLEKRKNKRSVSRLLALTMAVIMTASLLLWLPVSAAEGEGRDIIAPSTSAVWRMGERESKLDDANLGMDFSVLEDKDSAHYLFLGSNPSAGGAAYLWRIVGQTEDTFTLLGLQSIRDISDSDHVAKPFPPADYYDRDEEVSAEEWCDYVYDPYGVRSFTQAEKDIIKGETMQYIEVRDTEGGIEQYWLDGHYIGNSEGDGVFPGKTDIDDAFTGCLRRNEDGELIFDPYWFYGEENSNQARPAVTVYKKDILRLDRLHKYETQYTILDDGAHYKATVISEYLDDLVDEGKIRFVPYGWYKDDEIWTEEELSKNQEMVTKDQIERGILNLAIDIDPETGKCFFVDEGLGTIATNGAPCNLSLGYKIVTLDDAGDPTLLKSDVVFLAKGPEESGAEDIIVGSDLYKQHLSKIDGDPNTDPQQNSVFTLDFSDYVKEYGQVYAYVWLQTNCNYNGGECCTNRSVTNSFQAMTPYIIALGKAVDDGRGSGTESNKPPLLPSTETFSLAADKDVTTEVVDRHDTGSSFTYPTGKVPMTEAEFNEALAPHISLVGSKGTVITDLSFTTNFAAAVNRKVTGDYNVTVTVKHEGKTYTDTVTVSVVDTTPPPISCEPSIMLAEGITNPTYELLMREGKISATDNYSLDENVTIELFYRKSDGSMAALSDGAWHQVSAEHIVVIVATDEAGNQSQKEMIVKFPKPNIDSEIVPNEDGTWTEIGDDGTPLGNWVKDDNGEWVFVSTPETPLGMLPHTGTSTLLPIIFLALLCLAGGASMRKKKA